MGRDPGARRGRRGHEGGRGPAGGHAGRGPLQQLLAPRMSPRTGWPGVPAAALAAARLLALGAEAGAQQAPGAASRGPGRLVIVGGALARGNAEVYGAIIEGRTGDGPFCIIPTASAEPAASTASAVEAFGAYAGGVAVVGIPLDPSDPSKADDPAVAAEIGRCSGFFFVGGVQSRVLDVFLPQGRQTEAYRALMRRWNEGAVVSGSSAGAAMMSGVMISGGSSAGALERGISSGAEGQEEEGESGVIIEAGMGFYRDALLDQHFLARGRIGRLLVAVLATDSVPVGFGIDENTALVVEGGHARVLGASGVVVVDGRQARRSSPTRGSGLRVALAGTGDSVDLKTLEVRAGADKVPVPVSGAALTFPEDPFARFAFLQLLRDLAASPEGEATFRLGTATLTIR
ncbi:MAG: cyanophycinase, partial [Gemmatimonadetes bacterium]|nr:cyanophycinase [Gemmatimonadota bacterium]